MLIFGGGDGNSHLFGDVWSLSLAAPAWLALNPSGPLPSARAGQTAVYDPVSDGMLVFGGNDRAPRNDVWMLTGALTAWTAVSVAPLPTARQGQSMIHDPVRERVLVFGGYDGSNTFYNDVWAFALTGPPGWTALAPAGFPPAARAGHCAIYDPVRDRMIVFAGVDSTSARHDVWALQLAGTPTWSVLATNGTGPAGDGQTAIYDPIRDRMVVFGSVVSSDVWFLSLGDSPSWTTVTLPGAPPPRIDHSAVYDSTRDRMVVFGGNNGSNALDDVWALDLSGPGWVAMSPAGAPPSPRWFHSAVYDPVRDRMVVFGGYGGGQSNDTWALTFSGTPAWNPLAPSGTPPAARSRHSSIYSRLRDGMVTFGGANGLNLNDVWALLWDSPVTGVPPRHAGSMLRVVGLRPNPAIDRMTVSYMLSNSSPARLELFDLVGRLVISRRLESVGPGFHELNLGFRLPVGAYMVRLTQGDQHAVARSVVVH